MRKRLLVFNIILILTIFSTSCNKEKGEVENQITKNENSSVSSQHSNLSIDLKEIYKLAWQAIDKEPDKALLYSNELLKVSQNQNDKKGELLAYYTIGYIYEGKKMYSAALNNFLESLKLAIQMEESQIISDCYHFIGVIHFKVDLYEDAITYYNKALENVEDQKMIAKIYRDIGVAYRENKEYNRSKDYFIKSLTIQKIVANQYDLANAYNSIGNLLKEMNEFDQALEYFNQCLLLGQSLSEDKLTAVALYNIGYIYYKQKNYSQAKEFYINSLTHADKVMGFPELLISINRDLGLNELAINKTNDAIVYLEKAEEIAQGNNNSKLLIEVTGLLSEAYKKKGDDKRALFYSDKSRNIQTENFKEQFKEIEEQFKQRSEVERISRGSFINKKNKSGNQILWLVGILIGLVSGAGITLAGMKRKVKIVEKPMIKLRDPKLVDLSWWHINQLKWIEEEAIETKKLIRGIEAVIKESLDKPTKDVIEVILVELKERLKMIKYWCTATNDIDPTPPTDPKN